MIDSPFRVVNQRVGFERLPDHRHRKPGPASARARARWVVHSSWSSSEDLSANAPTRSKNNADLSVIEITVSSDDENVYRGKGMSPTGGRPPSQNQTNGCADSSPVPVSDDGLLVLYARACVCATCVCREGL